MAPIKLTLRNTGSQIRSSLVDDLTNGGDHYFRLEVIVAGTCHCFVDAICRQRRHRTMGAQLFGYKGRPCRGPLNPLRQLLKSPEAHYLPRRGFHGTASIHG